MKSSLAVTLLLQSSVASKKGKCPFGYTSEDSKLLQTEDDLSKYLYPKQLPGFEGTEDHIRVPTGTAKEDLYKKITKAVWKAHDDLPSTGKDRQQFIGCLLRTTGHDFMDFRYTADDDGNFVEATGGSDGCINFKDPDNKGIPQCLTRFKVADIYKTFKDQVSLADFFVIMAEAIAARAATAWTGESNAWGEYMSLEARFMRQFKFGRKTSHACTDANGMMPNPEEGCADLKRIFLDHIYLNVDLDTPWKRLTAISGVHTIGGMHKENSGYVGEWTTTPAVFNNEYYILMVNKGWGPRRNIEKNHGKNAWEIIDLSARDPDNEVYKEHNWRNILYLNTDMCLAYNNNFDTMAIKPMYQKFKDKDGERKPGVPKLQNPRVVWSSESRKQLTRRGNLLNAKNRNCCAWFSEKDLFKNPKENYNEGNQMKWEKNWRTHDYCGHKITQYDYDKAKFNQFKIKEDCCGGLDGWAETGNTWEDTQPLNCEYHGDVRGPAIEHVMQFANDEMAWLEAYLDAWKVATNNVIDFTQNQAAAKRFFDQNYDRFYGLEDEEHVECEGEGEIGCRKLTEVKQAGVWTGASTGYKVKGYRNFYDKQNKKFVEESRSIWESNEGYREHICLMRENTYDPQFWVDRGNHEGHTCYGLQFTETRAPYDNVAALERTKHFSEMDPNWEQYITDEIGVGVTLVPSGKAARQYYADWAKKDQEWRDKWANKKYD